MSAIGAEIFIGRSKGNGFIAEDRMRLLTASRTDQSSSIMEIMETCLDIHDLLSWNALTKA
jgi:hypothetical protein